MTDSGGNVGDCEIISMTFCPRRWGMISRSDLRGWIGSSLVSRITYAGTGLSPGAVWGRTAVGSARLAVGGWPGAKSLGCTIVGDTGVTVAVAGGTTVGGANTLVGASGVLVRGSEASGNDVVADCTDICVGVTASSGGGTEVMVEGRIVSVGNIEVGGTKSGRAANTIVK